MIHGETLSARHSSGTKPPATPAPDQATDCHIHIFDPRFAGASGRAEGLVATAADNLALRRRLGLSRSVVVYPSSYNGDNAALLDALDQMGDSARGVIHLAPDATEASLKAMHARGVRGVRMYLSRENPPAPDTIRAVARRIAPLGWHIQFVVREEALIASESVLADLPCPIVFDHFAHLAQPKGVKQPAGETIHRLLDLGRTYLKLSCVYSVSKAGNPGYGDLAETARTLVSWAPERMLWGTDWPHTTVKDPAPKPDGALLFDLLTEWAPDEETRHRILVHNPQSLYWSA